MQRIGSRAQVMHGNAKMTGGGLKKKDLKYNKQGKIVSKKMSAIAKKEKRLQKAGYTTKKGQFGAIKTMRGGDDKVKKFTVLIEGCDTDNQNEKYIIQEITLDWGSSYRTKELSSRLHTTTIKGHNILVNFGDLYKPSPFGEYNSNSGSRSRIFYCSKYNNVIIKTGKGVGTSEGKFKVTLKNPSNDIIEYNDYTVLENNPNITRSKIFTKTTVGTSSSSIPNFNIKNYRRGQQQ